jgi:hypothetical protein
MILNSPYISGSLTVTGNEVVTGSLTVLGGITGAITGSATSASYASNASFLNGLGSEQFVPTGSFNTFSSSILTYTGSANSRLSSLETASGSAITRLSALEVTSGSNITRLGALEVASGSAITRLNSIETVTGSNITRLSSLEAKTGSYATTGSNTFDGGQYLSSSFNPTGFSTTASLYTDGGLRVTRDAYISGTLYLNNVTVFGTQSVAYISSSQLNIGTNLITVNTDTPSIRFGGLAVYDSGSTGLTGSILWDSQNNHWVYTNPSGSTYSGGMFISGPRASSLGTEQGTTSCMLLAGQGGDHLTSSMIYHSSTVTCIPNTLIGSTVCSTMVNAGCIGIGTTSPSDKLDIAGSVRISSTNFFRYDGDTGLFGSGTSIAGGTATQLGIRAANDILFATSGSTERMRITSTGIATFACQICTTALVTADSRYTGTGYLTYDTANTGTECFIIRKFGTAVLTFNSNSSATFACQVCVPRLQVFNTNSIVVIEGTATNGEGTLTIAGKNSSGTSRSAIFKYDNADIIRVATADAIPMRFETSDVTRMTISSTGISCFSCQVCANAGLISNTLSISCNSGDDRAMFMSLNCSANYNSGAANTIARSVSSLKFLWYNNCWEIGATRGDDTAIQALVFARQGNTYLAMTCHGIANFSCQICAPNAVLNCLGAGAAWSTAGGTYQPIQIKAGLANSGLWVESCENDSGLYINHNSTSVLIGGSYRSSAGYKDVQIQTAGSTRIMIKCAGNVGIGTDGPSARLHVYSTVSCTTAPTLFLTQFDGNGQGYGHIASQDKNHGIIMRGTPISYLNYGVVAGDQMSFYEYGDDFRFYRKTDANDMQLQVQFSGGVIYARNTTVQSLSDISTKENIRNSEEGLNIITCLRPVRFDFKEGYSDGKKNQLGFIAQEVENIFPDAVSTMKTNSENEMCLKTMGPGALIPVLVKAIQEQQCTINTLKTCLGIV